MEPIKPALIRGGAEVPIRIRSLIIRRKQLAAMAFAIVKYGRKSGRLKSIQIFFAAMNTVLSETFGCRIALGGSSSYIHIGLLTFPFTIAGYLLEQAISVLGPLTLVFGRGIENMPEEDPMVCRAISHWWK